MGVTRRWIEYYDVLSYGPGGTRRRGGAVMGGGQSTYQAGILETWDQIIERRCQMSPTTEPTNTSSVSGPR